MLKNLFRIRMVIRLSLGRSSRLTIKRSGQSVELFEPRQIELVERKKGRFGGRDEGRTGEQAEKEDNAEAKRRTQGNRAAVRCRMPTTPPPRINTNHGGAHDPRIWAAPQRPAFTRRDHVKRFSIASRACPSGFVSIVAILNRPLASLFFAAYANRSSAARPERKLRDKLCGLPRNFGVVTSFFANKSREERLQEKETSSKFGRGRSPHYSCQPGRG